MNFFVSSKTKHFLRFNYYSKLLNKSNQKNQNNIYSKFFQLYIIQGEKNITEHLSKKLCQQICCVCGDFHNTQSKYLHTSQNLYKKQIRKPITVSRTKSKAKVVTVWKNMTVSELASALDKTIDQLFEVFLYVPGSDRFDSRSSVISDLKVIQQAAKLSGFRCLIRAPFQLNNEEDTVNKDATKKPPAPESELEPRPPIVTIMGHVDHGKTTLLDALRHSSVVEGEFGGITQHIGAFEVKLASGEQVTFLDTPGHAAFSAMRARGANVTDIIVLVVAADDGVLPQTAECANLAKESNTPVIVAINKIDKAEANLEKCKRDILNVGLQLEEQGGEVQCVEISALKGLNLSNLVECLVTQAQLMDLKATRKGLVEGSVIEAKQDSHKGKIATCLVERGTLSKGDILVSTNSWCKVRSIFNDGGKVVDKALPGSPVQITGWREDLPSAGDELLEVENERRAREVLQYRLSQAKHEKSLVDHKQAQVKLEEHLVVYKEQLKKKREMGIRFKLWRGIPAKEKQFKEDTSPRVSLVLKGDVQGSVEAILDVLDTYHSDDCALDVISYGVGEITPGDIDLAKSFKGSIYAFNLPASQLTKAAAAKNGVQIFEYNIIYRLIDKLKEQISEQLPELPVEEVVGEAVVQKEFLITEGKKKIPVAGSLCVKGTIKKNSKCKLIRGTETIYDGKLESLKNLKTEVESIGKGVECGVRFPDPKLRVSPGDSIICYRINMVEQSTDWSPDGF